MALSIDGPAVLTAILNAPEAFADIAADLNALVGTLVVKQMKAKSLTIAGIRGMYKAIGERDFMKIVEGLKDSDVKAVTTALDKGNADLKAATAPARREHLLALAEGKREPTVKTAAPAKSKAPKPTEPKPKAKTTKKQPQTVERAVSSKSMAAKWDGTDRG